MPLEVADHAGFCMGVQRAVEMAEKAAQDGIPSCTLGELIHNPAVVVRLEAEGLKPVRSAEEAKGRRVLIRSHGVSRQTMEELEKAGCEILDLTCPFVSRMHRIVEESSRDGTPVILVGESEHPEVQGTAGWAHGEVRFVATPEDAAELHDLIGSMNCHVNLMPVNPIEERDYRAPEPSRALAFKNLLEKYGINATIRRKMGADIDSACGQLRRRHTEG